MELSQNKILTIVLLAAIAMGGLIVLQFMWIDSGIKAQEDRFNKQIGPMLAEINRSIEKDNDLKQNLNYVFPDCPENALPDTVTLYSLKSDIRNIIDESSGKRGIFTTHDFALVERPGRQGSHEVIFSTNEDLNEELLNSDFKTAATMFRNRDAHINIIFPDKEMYLARQIWGQLAISLIFILLIIGCFVYAVFIIRKQKKLSEMKNDFINNLTHEFKTPIFSISLASKVLGKSLPVSKDEKLRGYLDLIDNENARLKNQVDKVLQIALLDSGTFRLEKKEIDLHEVIKSTADGLKIRIQELSGTLNMRLNADRNMLFADETHLSNIVYNLLDNAVKYSEGAPEITIQTKDIKEGVQLIIRDKGIGMAPEAMKYIFDKFYRANSGNDYKVKGFGLGLSYVKQIVDAHKGLITLDSKLRKGSEFTITLPTQ